MCGIWGGIGYSLDSSLLEILAYRNQRRGRDATGFYNGIGVYKDAKEAMDFIPKHRRQLRNYDRFIIGHTRASSCYGTANDPQCAHPFTIKHITGVHNGIINNEETLEDIIDQKYKVDSQYLIHAIATNNLHQASGWLAVVWYNRLTDSISFCRHNAPLWIGTHKGNYYFSSQRNDLKGFCTKIFTPKEDMVYTFSLKEKAWSLKAITFIGTPDKKVYKYEIKNCKPYTKLDSIIDSHSKPKETTVWDDIRMRWTRAYC